MPLTTEQEDELLRGTLDQLRSRVGTGTAGRQENLDLNRIGNAIYDFDRRASEVADADAKEKLRNEILRPVLQQLGVPTPKVIADEIQVAARPDGSIVKLNVTKGTASPFQDQLTAPATGQLPSPIHQWGANKPTESPGFVYMGSELPEPMTKGVGYDTRGEAAARTAWDSSKAGSDARYAQAYDLANPRLPTTDSLTGPMSRPTAERAPHYIQVGADNKEGFAEGTYEITPNGFKKVGPPSRKSEGSMLEQLLARESGGALPSAGDAPSVGKNERVSVISPDGKRGSIPRSQLDEALKKGYRQ